MFRQSGVSPRTTLSHSMAHFMRMYHRNREKCGYVCGLTRIHSGYKMAMLEPRIHDQENGTMRIVLAEPNEALANALTSVLSSDGHAVDTAESCDQAAGLLSCSEPSYDLIIIDDVLDDDASGTPAIADAHTNGTRLLALRSVGVISTPERPEDVWQPCDPCNGSLPERQPQSWRYADDELEKPFTDSELLAHVRDLDEATPAAATPSAMEFITCGALTLDTINRRAFYGGLAAALPLSPREYGALEALAKAGGRFLSFDEIVTAVCGNGMASQREIMTHAMYSLSNKLRRVGFFITRRGNSYRIR